MTLTEIQPVSPALFVDDGGVGTYDFFDVIFDWRASTQKARSEKACTDQCRAWYARVAAKWRLLSIIVWHVMHCHDRGSHLVKLDSYRFTGFWDMAGNADTQTGRHTDKHKCRHALTSSILTFFFQNQRRKKQTKSVFLSLVIEWSLPETVFKMCAW